MGFLDDVEKEVPGLVTPNCRAAIEGELPEALGFIRSSTAKMDRLINDPDAVSRGAPQACSGTSRCREASRGAGEKPLSTADDWERRDQDRGAAAGCGKRSACCRADLRQHPRKRREVPFPRSAGRDRGLRCRRRLLPSLRDRRQRRGISRKDFERIFDLFRRSGEQDMPGEGIGLAYVRNLVRRLGGSVSVESELGRGSTFTIKLPTSFVVGLAQTCDAPAESCGSQKRALAGIE